MTLVFFLFFRYFFVCPQEMLANVTALQQQQQQQQQWSTDVASSDGDGSGDGDGDGSETPSAARRAPKIHSGFKRAYVSVNGTLSAVLRSAMEGEPEVRHPIPCVYE